MSIQEYYDRYIELTRYVPEAFRHQHFVSEALVDRVRNAQNLHWKARGREDLHDVTMDELLANISKEYDKKHQTHEALTAYMGFNGGAGHKSRPTGHYAAPLPFRINRRRRPLQSLFPPPSPPRATKAIGPPASVAAARANRCSLPPPPALRNQSPPIAAPS